MIPTKLIFDTMVNLFAAGSGTLNFADTHQPWLFVIDNEFTPNPALVYADVSLHNSGITPDVIPIAADGAHEVFNDPNNGDRVIRLGSSGDGFFWRRTAGGSPWTAFGIGMSNPDTSVLLAVQHFDEAINTVANNDGISFARPEFRFPVAMFI